MTDCMYSNEEYYENEEAIADIKKLEDKDEIKRIFSAIETKIATCYHMGHPLSQSCQNDLANLKTSIRLFQRQLLEEVQLRTDDFPVTTARKLQDTLDDVLNPNQTVSLKGAAINHFRNTARNARFSHDTKVATAAIIGGIVGLALWAILTIASGGIAGLVTFAGLGLAALIATFGAAHFAARSDSLIKNSNPYETRGKQVSYNLKALLRHREELFPAPQKHSKKPIPVYPHVVFNV